jgi:hypothetical protein
LKIDPKSTTGGVHGHFGSTRAAVHFYAILTAQNSISPLLFLFFILSVQMSSKYLSMMQERTEQAILLQHEIFSWG